MQRFSRKNLNFSYTRLQVQCIEKPGKRGKIVLLFAKGISFLDGLPYIRLFYIFKHI